LREKTGKNTDFDFAQITLNILVAHLPQRESARTDRVPPSHFRMPSLPLLLLLAALAAAMETTATSSPGGSGGGSGGCVIPVGGAIQEAIDHQIAAAGAGAALACSLAAGTHTISRPVLLPPRFHLRGAGAVGATTVVAAITPSAASAPGWPHASVAGRSQPLLGAFYSNASAVFLSNLSISAGLGAAQRHFSNARCGVGTGSDATDPGFGACRFLAIGVFLDGATGSRLSGLAVRNSSRGIYVRKSTDVQLLDSTFEDNGFGSQWSDAVDSSHNITVTRCRFRGSLGHGFTIRNSTAVVLADVTATDNQWHGVHVLESRALRLSGLQIHANGKCGIVLATVTGFELADSSITRNACTGQGGLCFSGLAPGPHNGVVRDSVIDGNGGNIIGSEAWNVNFTNIQCSYALYKGKAWALQCARCKQVNVNCVKSSSTASPTSAELAAEPQAAVQVMGWQGERSLINSPSAACVVEPGQDIQPHIDAAASGRGRNKCLLKRGVHKISRPIILPSNFGAPKIACSPQDYIRASSWALLPID
jgi:parallel beta-helix repeat protein